MKRPPDWGCLVVNPGLQSGWNLTTSLREKKISRCLSWEVSQASPKKTMDLFTWKFVAEIGFFKLAHFHLMCHYVIIMYLSSMSDDSLQSHHHLHYPSWHLWHNFETSASSENAQHPFWAEEYFQPAVYEEKDKDLLWLSSDRCLHQDEGFKQYFMLLVLRLYDLAKHQGLQGPQVLMLRWWVRVWELFPTSHPDDVWVSPTKNPQNSYGINRTGNDWQLYMPERWAFPTSKGISKHEGSWSIWNIWTKLVSNMEKTSSYVYYYIYI